MRGKRDAGKSSAKVAQVVTVTVSPLKGATSRCSNNNIIQERGGAEAEPSGTEGQVDATEIQGMKAELAE